MVMSHFIFLQIWALHALIRDAKDFHHHYISCRPLLYSIPHGPGSIYIQYHSKINTSCWFQDRTESVKLVVWIPRITTKWVPPIQFAWTRYQKRAIDVRNIIFSSQMCSRFIMTVFGHFQIWAGKTTVVLPEKSSELLTTVRYKMMQTHASSQEHSRKVSFVKIGSFLVKLRLFNGHKFWCPWWSFHCYSTTTRGRITKPYTVDAPYQDASNGCFLRSLRSLLVEQWLINRHFFENFSFFQ